MKILVNSTAFLWTLFLSPQSHVWPSSKNSNATRVSWGERMGKWTQFYRAPAPTLNRICIAFNEAWRDDPLHRRWFVFENGKRRLAEEVSVFVSFDASIAPESDELGFDYVCMGRVEWVGNNARIR